MKIAIALLAALVLRATAFAMPPPERIDALRRGVNIAGWFRFPGSLDPGALRAWIGDPAIADLKRAGFTFVRLAADPAVLGQPGMRAIFVEQVRRLQAHGLAVAISPHPVAWHLDTDPAHRALFEAFWRELAAALRPLPPALTFPEVLNEPVFGQTPEDWPRWQHDLLRTIRTVLPANTVILTGADWGSIAGLLALPPESDPNVVYSFHFYDPAELTSLAAYRPGLDRAVLARLRFPETSVQACETAAAGPADPATAGLIRFYCAMNWDAARVRARLADAVAWARRHDATVMAGEFGASARLNPDSRLAWLRLVRETCAENRIGWALWGYDDIMGFDISRPPGMKPVLDRSVLGALGLTRN